MIEGVYIECILFVIIKVSDVIQGGSWGNIAGWGISEKNAEEAEPEDYLKAAVVETFSWDECAYKVEGFPTNYFANYIPLEGIICEGRGGGASCSGDSGGPLVIHGSQAAIVSSALRAECNDPQSLTIFTNVVYYRDWIKKVAGV